VGSYTLVGTPYTGAGGGGTAGTPLTISFQVMNQPVTAPLARKELAGPAAQMAVTNSITAYPNPFQDFIQVKIEAEESEVYHIRVYDQIGKLQFQEQFTPVSPGADMHTLRFSAGTARQPGIYLIVVENARGNIRKVIKVLKTQ
jgi:Secretion system C-terminal sorting domain